MPNDRRRQSHLIIGALPPPIGGTTVLLEQLVHDLIRKEKLDISVINTTVETQGAIGKIQAFFRVLAKVFQKIRTVDTVGFHGSINGAMIFFPFLRIICFCFKKPILLRAFGGDFDERFSLLSGLKKKLLRITMLSADMLLFETKRSVMYFEEISETSVYWYANSRPYEFSLKNNNIKKQHSPFKVIFIGHVKPSKGVRELVLAANACSKKVSVDIYGPLSEGIVESELNTANTNYLGALKPEQILAVIANYDVLALPTYYEGEGYPGVILEAYTQAVPVISTKWRCIPEIVDDSSGVLVEPKSVHQLSAAIDKMAADQDGYQKLSSGAVAQAEKYSSIKWSEEYYQLVQSLYKKIAHQ